jgi:hypothetical protein
MRWNKPDPAGGVDGLNLYAFCIGNPVSMKDADGLSAKGKEQPEKTKRKGFCIKRQLRNRCR